MSLNVELLEQSFERIKPCADEFVASFYERLFAAHPEVKPLFATTEMEKQRKMLLNALVLVVQNLRNPEVLGQVLNSPKNEREAPGFRHGEELGSGFNRLRYFFCIGYFVGILYP